MDGWLLLLLLLVLLLLLLLVLYCWFFVVVLSSSSSSWWYWCWYWCAGGCAGVGVCACAGFVRNSSSQTCPLALAGLADLLQCSSLSTCLLAGLPVACFPGSLLLACLLAHVYSLLLGCRLASLLALFMMIDHSLVFICLQAFQHFLFSHLIDFLLRR